MQSIPIASAEPDMVLARDVRRVESPQGPTICGRGTVLTSGLIERLKNLGIKSITVEGNPLAAEGENNLENLLAELDHRFRKVDNVPLMRKLKGMYEALLIRSMGGTRGR
ncbi:hypothetical protein GURASL_26320 [Geotalea uraniireducens]|uniref:Uncharacterized protein n=1 Tax=Geotalea uraniireducens TaxID=351604 RepID=A0ABN6VUE2_9BACT|nr:hypothetical protein [Geotalea uraniireducens]BDV43709.1 hypothetical protein GURASL_26320 [Geotalea uraniireducens]